MLLVSGPLKSCLFDLAGRDPIKQRQILNEADRFVSSEQKCRLRLTKPRVELASLTILLTCEFPVNHQITGFQGRDVAEQMKEPS